MRPSLIERLFAWMMHWHHSKRGACWKKVEITRSLCPDRHEVMTIEFVPYGLLRRFYRDFNLQPDTEWWTGDNFHYAIHHVKQLKKPARLMLRLDEVRSEDL